MKRFFAITILSLLLEVASAQASDIRPLMDHFFGPNQSCVQAHMPVVLVFDMNEPHTGLRAALTAGEIDDSNSALVWAKRERQGCVDVLAVVSIHGNSGSSQAAIHAVMEQRLHDLGLHHWVPKLLPGPSRRLQSWHYPSFSEENDQRLQALARVINRAPGPVVIAEHGPLTTSAGLLVGGYVEPKRVKRILGVGGRPYGQDFVGPNGRRLPFRDMNIATDTKAADYLVRHHGPKLWLVNFWAGLRTNAVEPHYIAMAYPLLTEHAFARGSELGRYGSGGRVWSWDTWLTRYTASGADEALGCQLVRARMVPHKSTREPWRLAFVPFEDAVLEDGWTTTVCSGLPF
jgi:hypothetical protein